MKNMMIALFLIPLMVWADTPPPGTVKAKMFTGDGVTSITATGSSLNSNITNSSLAVTGSFFQATQPVSLVTLPALTAGSAIIGKVGIDQTTPGTTNGVQVNAALPTGANTIGAVNINGTVPISGTITATNSANGNTGSAVPAAATLVGGTDGTNLRALKVSSLGVLSVDGSSVTQPISAASLPLPAGAATAAGLTTINTTLGTPFQAGGSIGNSSFGISGTLPAYAATPTFNLGTLNGAATASLQTTGNTSLSTIATNTGNIPAQGQALAAGSLPVVLTAAQLSTLTPLSSVTVSGTVTANAGTGTFAVSAASLPLPTGAATAAKQPALGTAGTPAADVLTVQGATSMIALKVDGSGVTQPISAASLPLPAGAATAAGLTTINTTLGSPFQAGASIGNSSFGATQATAANLNATVVGPAGAALAKDSSLTTINTTLGTPMQQTGGTVTANAGSGTFAVSASALPLPSGAATSALQTTGNTSLNSIDTKVPTQGQKTMSASLPVTLASDQSTISVTSPDTYITGAAAQTATVNNILPASSGATATDVSGYQAITVQVVSTGTGGTFIFEGSNDNTNFQTLPVFSQLVLTGTPITAAIAATSSSLVYTFPATVRYIRLRIATTITGGSIQAFTRISQQAWIPAITTVSQATAANLATTATIASGTVTTVSTVTSVASAALATNTNVADLASTAKVATFTLALTPAAGTLSQAFQINTSAVTGTTPTMDCSILESLDNGTTYSNTVYQFERITANLSNPLISPLIRYTGNKLEWSCVIAGTTPSFTMTLNRMASQASASIQRRWFDRTITLTSLNSTTATFDIEGCSNISFGMANSTAGTPATLDLQLSEDGTVFESQGTTITPASNASASIQGLSVSSKFARLIVTSAGVSETLTYAWVRCGGI